MIAAVALTLTLQMAPVVEDPATSTHLPMSVLAEGPSRPHLRSWTWIPAGAYGMATFTAGLAGVVVNNEGRLGQRDLRTGNTAMVSARSSGSSRVSSSARKPARKRMRRHARICQWPTWQGASR